MALTMGENLDGADDALEESMAATLVTFHKGQALFTQGDPANALFYIREGRIKITVVSEHGKEAVVEILEPGSFCGEGCLAGQRQRMASAVAMVNSSFGLLSKPWLPFPVRFIFAILLLDLVRYAVHWSYHVVPFLWRVHHVHHSDPDLDVSTGARAHPIEVILTQGANLATVAILAAPPAAVLTTELLSCAESFFSHANASLPGWLERPLRWMFVTPDMHRIHHSQEFQEQSKNLGDVFPWWDRLFRTYLEAPAAGQDRMLVGLKGFQSDESLDVSFMLLQPFRIQRQETEETPATRPD